MPITKDTITDEVTAELEATLATAGATPIPGPIPTPIPTPIPFPLYLTVSGLYATTGVIPGLTGPEIAGADTPIPAPEPIPTPIPLPILQGQELRLDVDGRYSQMTASGTVPASGGTRAHWIAKLRSTGSLKYAGDIWYRDAPAVPFLYTGVEITVTRQIFTGAHTAVAKFTGRGLPDKTVSLSIRSPYFHKVDFEYDYASGVTPVTQINTGAHPNRPATLPVENLSIETVFRRAGFDVSLSTGGSVPPALSGPGGQWSDMEMHDAMQTYWSRFADVPQWAMWVFFAPQHEMGTSLGGVMFDDIGPNHRQGTSIFYNSFISNAPAGDANPAAWVARMRFWTAVHEMGHAFNLAHSWQKALGGPADAPYGSPWMPIGNEPEARSFMNYPYNVTGGQTAFFANFEFRFSDQELLFMRHAPGRFVQMGHAGWFDHHGFEGPKAVEPKLKIDVRVNRDKPIFDFLEPVMLEFKVTNISPHPVLFDQTEVTNFENLTLIIKKKDKGAKQYMPYARRCIEPKPTVLMPGESLYEVVFASAGLNGYDLAEPGFYMVQACLHHEDGNIISKPLNLRIKPPRGYDEELLAQDLYSGDVGRVLAFDGSRVLDSANDALRMAVDRLPNTAIAKHARIALAKPLLTESKQLVLRPGQTTMLRPASESGGEVVCESARPDEAKKELEAAILAEPDKAAETLSHIDYRYYAESLAKYLAKNGDRREATRVQKVLYETLAARNVKPEVLEQIKVRHAATA